METAAGPQTDERHHHRKVKVCREVECDEKYNQLSEEARTAFLEFSYCPFCSNELVIQCSACRESLADKGYNYCPWCGCQYD